MTLQPTTDAFVSGHAAVAKRSGPGQPKVTHHYWGLRIAPPRFVFGLADIVRVLSGFVVVFCAFAVWSFWTLPSFALSGDATSDRVAACVLVLAIAGMFMPFVLRGTQVHVDIDRQACEIREITIGVFGAPRCLARYGVDGVERICLVGSGTRPGYGQLQIVFHNGMAIPAGEGAIGALEDLRRELRTDCGLGQERPAVPTDWAEPLAL